MPRRPDGCSSRPRIRCDTSIAHHSRCNEDDDRRDQPAVPRCRPEASQIDEKSRHGNPIPIASDPTKKLVTRGDGPWAAMQHRASSKPSSSGSCPERRTLAFARRAPCNGSAELRRLGTVNIGHHAHLSSEFDRSARRAGSCEATCGSLGAGRFSA